MKFDGRTWVKATSSGSTVLGGLSDSVTPYRVPRVWPLSSFPVSHCQFSEKVLVDSVWRIIRGDGYSTKEKLTTLSRAFYEGVPYVAYRDGSNGGKATVLRHQG